MVDSKLKGRAYEYRIRDVLTKNFGIKFERVPLSGALPYMKGDLFTMESSTFPWCIEVKNHKEVPFNNLLISKSSPLLQFWAQTCSQAVIMKKHPLLIFKWDRSKDYCCWIDDLVTVNNYMHISSKYGKFNMCIFDDWLVQAKQVKY